MLTLGVGVLIVTGGIDLSIGSLVGLGAVVFGLLCTGRTGCRCSALLVVAGRPLIGLAHGCW